MRKVLVALAVVATIVLATAGLAGGDRTARRVGLPAGITVSLPSGWHLLRGWLSDVLDPAPRLAVASFPVRLSRHTCACGFPNVVRFPRHGAFVFVWEYLRTSRSLLARVPRRPASFQLSAGPGVRLTCDGPTDTFGFQQAGRDFQVEVYLGPGAGPALRAQAAALLDSLRAAPGLFRPLAGART